MATISEAKERRVSIKRNDVLRAATDTFLEVGYGRASMDEIAAKASVSKATIYSHFGSKEALFEEIIRELVQALMMPLSMAGLAATPEQTLTAFARRYVELLLAPSSLSLHRLLISEATRNRDLAAAAYRVGGERAIRTLADYLAQETANGKLSVNEPTIAAEQLFGMLTGHLQIRALLGVEARRSPDRLDRHISTAIEVFLRAYQPGFTVSANAITGRDGSGS